MTDQAKRRILVFFVLAVMTMVLIAAGLSQLQLNPGIPLPDFEGTPGPAQTETNPIVAITVNTLFKAILGTILTLVVVFGIYKILRKAPWKDVLSRLLALIVLTVVALLVLFLLFKVRISFTSLASEELPPAVDIKGPPLAPLPPSLLWLVLIGMAVLAILLVIWVVNWRARHAAAGDELKLEAERALQALKTGLDFKNVIIQCYWQMSQVLQKERGIERKEAMTAREFERLLEQRGIPHPPVHQLTQLFETARYSIRPSVPEDEQKAFECLNAIIQYSHKE
jgi:hypothetical protein